MDTLHSNEENLAGLMFQCPDRAVNNLWNLSDEGKQLITHFSMVVKQSLVGYKQRTENMSISNIISRQILFSKEGGKVIN